MTPSNRSRPKRSQSTPASAPSGLVCYGPIAALVLLAVGLLVSESLLATIIIVSEAAVVMLVWIAAVGLGWWAITPLRLPDMPLRWQLVAAAGVGIGLLSLLVLVLGWLGVLHRVVWVVLLVAMMAACVVRAGIHVRRSAALSGTDRPFRWRADHLLWLPAVAFLLIGLLAATIPPGLNWPHEAGGYDVLEYHFGGPKEYWLAGRVLPLPHNLYTYLPASAEMLYLLAFVIKGGPFDGVYLAQLLNASLAIWAVAAAWLAGREFGPVQGTLAGTLAATCPWLAYLSGVAYVENGMLFACMLSLAVIVRIHANPTCRHGSWYLLAGLVAGLACGYKYTAVPMVALPIGLVATWLGWRAATRRPLAPAMFAAGVVITFGPWLMKNARVAGNPVFPLAHAALGYRPAVWSNELAARWDRAHEPQDDERAAGARIGRLWQRVLGEGNYGPAIFLAALLALPAVFGSHRRLTIACLVIIAVQTITWLTATHLLARFAVPLIAPLVVLAAVGFSSLGSARAGTAHRLAMIAAIVVGMGANLVHLGRLYYHHTRDPDGQPRGWFGVHLAAAEAQPINRCTPPKGTRVWMVGEARAFYVARPCVYHVVFSRDPLAEFARTGPTGRQLLDWFRQRGITHVYVNWAEIDRFRRPGNYGWDEAVNESLFASMRSAGAVVTHQERDGRTGRAIYEILEVPAP